MIKNEREKENNGLSVGDQTLCVTHEANGRLAPLETYLINEK